jgi:hypothetical protein
VQAVAAALSTESIAVGQRSIFRLHFQEIDSELLQLAGVCDDAEVFPDEKPGMREPFPRLVGERRLSDRKARAEATATKAGAHEVVQSDEKPV